MIMRTVVAVSLLVLGTAGASHAQRAPQCETAYDLSFHLEVMFEPFISDDAIEVRRELNLVRQSPTAPHGIVRDNDTCVQLRLALARHLDLKNPTLLDQTDDLFFFRFGDYLGVLVTRRQLPTDRVVVSGTSPLYVFDRLSLKYVGRLAF